MKFKALLTVSFLACMIPVTAHASTDDEINEVKGQITFVNSQLTKLQKPKLAQPILVKLEMEEKPEIIRPSIMDLLNDKTPSVSELKSLDLKLKEHYDYLVERKEAEIKAEKERIEREKHEKIAREKAEKERIERERIEKEKAEKAEKERQEAEKAEKLKKEAEQKSSETAAESTPATTSSQSSNGRPEFGADGLLIESATSAAQEVINLALGIPGHSNGSGYHASTGMDEKINNLTVAEAVYVIHRIEGAGFGQTGAGWAGVDSPESHQAFMRQQVDSRFNGSIHELLRKWGTYSYGGY